MRLLSTLKIVFIYTTLTGFPLILSATETCKKDFDGCEAKNVPGGTLQNGNASCTQASVTWNHGKCKGTGPSLTESCVSPLVTQKNSSTTYTVATKIDGSYFCRNDGATEYEVQVRCPKPDTCNTTPEQ